MSEGQTAKSDTTRTKPCPVCGKRIEAGAIKCLHCNEFIEKYIDKGWRRFWKHGTGFRDKTVWDLLSLLVVPVMLLFISVWFSAAQRAHQSRIEATRIDEQRTIEANRIEAQQTIEADHAQESALQAYLEQMEKLLLEKDLRAPTPTPGVQSIARARTFTILRRLDPERQGVVLQFLLESELIRVGSVYIYLAGADLRGIDLYEAFLPEVVLSGTDLRKADLRKAFLFEADLSWAKLQEADLREVDLFMADLREANLQEADLREAYLHGTYLFRADLRGADLRGADLRMADLREASVTLEQLAQAKSLEGATMPDGTKHE